MPNTNGWVAAQGDERLALALSAARAGAFEIDFRNKAFWCSPEFVEIWGKVPELKGERTGGGWDGMHPEDRDGFNAMRTRWNQPGFEHYDVRTIAHADGRDRWVRIYFEVRGRT